MKKKRNLTHPDGTIGREEYWIPKNYPPYEKPRKRLTALTIEIAPALQTCREDLAN
jgi:hypothetical protein